jgi:hypothetical protein
MVTELLTYEPGRTKRRDGFASFPAWDVLVYAFMLP